MALLPTILLLTFPQTAAPPPLAFVENRGQWEIPARFVAQGGPLTALCEEGAVTLRLVKSRSGKAVDGVVLRLVFEGASREMRIEGSDRLPGVRHYLNGSAPADWRTGVPAYSGVRYSNLYDGIDLYLREVNGLLEYDLLLDADADLRVFSIRCEGIEGLEVDESGALLMRTARGPIRQSPPVAWQQLQSGERQPVACRFRLLGSDTFGFELESPDPTLPTIIDPGLEWSSFLGGSGPDVVFCVDLDSTGAPVVGGVTMSPDFPVVPGAFQTTYGGNGDAFVARFSPDGSTLVWATYLGGAFPDQADALVLAPNGEVLVTGMTDSPAFPVTAGAYDTSHNSPGSHPDVFVARLSADGASLVWSTFLGGQNGDEGWAIALGGSGEVTVGGMTWSMDYPVTPGAFDPSFNGGSMDACVSRLSADGSTLLWSTYLGGTGSPTTGDHFEGAYGIVLDPTNGVYVTGSALSADFPMTPGAHDPVYNGFMDVFVSHLDATGSALLASTFLGGNNLDEARAVAIDSSGAITLGGWTASSDFPATPGAYMTSLQGQADAFVARLDSALGTLAFSTFFGGSQDDNIFPLVVGPSGEITVAGFTDSADLPVVAGAWDTVFNGGSNPADGFVARFDTSASSLLYSTFLGGEGTDLVLGMDTDGAAGAVVVGVTSSSSFPVRFGSYDTTYNGTGDGFVARLELIPGPSLTQTALQRGQLASFTVVNADPGESVYYLYSLSGIGFGPAAPQLGGLGLDLLLPITLFGQASADPTGTAVLALTVPPNAPLAAVSTQAVVRRGPGGALSLKTNTVTDTIQP